jgi:hypothetical protein
MKDHGQGQEPATTYSSHDHSLREKERLGSESKVITRDVESVYVFALIIVAVVVCDAVQEELFSMRKVRRMTTWGRCEQAVEERGRDEQSGLSGVVYLFNLIYNIIQPEFEAFHAVLATESSSLFRHFQLLACHT